MHGRRTGCGAYLVEVLGGAKLGCVATCPPSGCMHASDKDVRTCSSAGSGYCILRILLTEQNQACRVHRNRIRNPESAAITSPPLRTTVQHRKRPQDAPPPTASVGLDPNLSPGVVGAGRCATAPSPPLHVIGIDAGWPPAAAAAAAAGSAAEMALPGASGQVALAAATRGRAGGGGEVAAAAKQSRQAGASVATSLRWSL